MKLINYNGNSLATGIYAIRNLINNKIYIGSTKKSFASRKNRHLLLILKNIHYNEHLQTAWNYYGENNFSFEILFLCSSNECDKYEGEFIKLYSSNNRTYGYNIANVSAYKYNYRLSEKHNNEKSIRKINKSLNLNGFETNERGITKPFKIYDLDGNFLKEYKSAKEYCIINNVKARGFLSNILKGRKLKYKNFIILFSNEILTTDDINRVKLMGIKKVKLYDLNNNYINTFNSSKECAKHIGCKEAEIRMCCLGKRSRIKQYITKY